MNWKTGLVVVLFLLVPAALVLADVVHMSDGRKIKGKIISETEDNVVLEGKYGKVTLRRDEIDHIERGPIEEKEKKPGPPKPAPEKKPRPKPKKRGTKDNLYALTEKAAKGDSSAVKKLVSAKRAALVPIAKKLEESEGEEKDRLQKLLDDIEQKTQAEKERAQKLYEEAAKLQEECVALQKKLGANATPEQQRQADKLLKALSSKLTEAFELDPTNNDIMKSVAKMAAMYYRGNAYSRSIPLLLVLYRHAPDNKDVIQMLASSYMNLKKFKDARKMLEKILERDSENATAWANLGVADLSESKFDAAIKDFEKAIALGMDTAALRHNLGVAYKHKKKWDKAAENFAKAFEMDSKNVQALFELGAMYANQQEYAKAVEAWEKLCKEFPDSQQAKAAKPQIKKLKKKVKK